MSRRGVEFAKLILMSAVAVFISALFVVGYSRDYLPKPFLLLSLLVIVPCWIATCIAWVSFYAKEVQRPPTRKLVWEVITSTLFITIPSVMAILEWRFSRRVEWFLLIFIAIGVYGLARTIIEHNARLIDQSPGFDVSEDTNEATSNQPAAPPPRSR